MLAAPCALAAAGPAFCHGVGHEDGGFGWSWDPWMLLLLAIAACLYLLGWQRLRRQGNARRVLGAVRLLSFAAGMLVLGLALMSPLDTLAERLFSAHMTQHLLLMLIAPPLLVWGRPVFVWLWAFPLAQRRRIGRAWVDTRALHTSHAFLMRPLMVWMTASIALWFWHIPAAYDWALADGRVHVLEHLSFFLTSLAFWTLTLEPYRHRRSGHGIALVMVVTFALHSGLLGALLTFAQAPLYRAYVTPVFGLSPLEDQQLAGLIMWVPASLVYLAALAALFVGWLSQVKAYSRPHELQKQ